MSCGACSSSGPTVLELLQQTPLYAYLDDKELEQLADAFVRKKIAKGKELPESPLYVLLSGEVEIIQNGKTLCKKHEGAFFSRSSGDIDEPEYSVGKPTLKDVGSRFSRASKRQSKRGIGRLGAEAALDHDEPRGDALARHEEERPTARYGGAADGVTGRAPPHTPRAARIDRGDNSPEIAAVIRTMSQDSVEKYLVKVPFIRRAQVRCFNAALSLFLFPRPAHHTPSLSL